MATHRASVTVNAPVHQVYELFSHFNDYPKFMSYIKEVTYIDDQRSHWVADVLGRHEWDAVNEDWIPDKQIGWRSVSGTENRGIVTFEPAGADQTLVAVAIEYTPPAGVLGAVGEALGGGATFETHLQHDLDHFAQMVEQAPPGALDPTSSAYLFHEDSAAARGNTTQAQNETMGTAGSGADASGLSSSAATLPGSTAADELSAIGDAPRTTLGTNTGTSVNPLEGTTGTTIPGTTTGQRNTL